MLLSILSLAISLLPVTLAQYGSPDDSETTVTSSTTTPAQAESTGSSGIIHKVTVGDNNQIAFSPDSFTAAIGDSVEFHFFPPTHTIVQSSFSAPCAPVNASAFYSGPMTTTTGENKNVFTIKVNTTDPIWFYCGFPGHCQAGMAGVVNPPSGQTIAQYISAAANSPSTKNPATVQGGIVGAASSVAPSSGSSSTTSSASTKASGNAGAESKGGIQWTMFALTGVDAIGIVSLII